MLSTPTLSCFQRVPWNSSINLKCLTDGRHHMIRAFWNFSWHIKSKDRKGGGRGGERLENETTGLSLRAAQENPDTVAMCRYLEQINQSLWNPGCSSGQEQWMDRQKMKFRRRKHGQGIKRHVRGWCWVGFREAHWCWGSGLSSLSSFGSDFKSSSARVSTVEGDMYKMSLHSLCLSRDNPGTSPSEDLLWWTKPTLLSTGRKEAPDT